MLYEKIIDLDNLKLAHKHARKDKSSYTAVQKTDANLEERMLELQQMLKNHTYKVGLYHTSRKYDVTKTRILFKLPYFPDRIIQWAIMNVIEPLFQQNFCDFTCASIAGRGIHQAYNILRDCINNDPTGTQYYLKMDIKKFYPSINQTILKDKLATFFEGEDELLDLLFTIIDSANHSDINTLNLTEEEQQVYCRSGYGLPTGSYLSQYLANFYLSSFDHWLIEQGCTHIVRYMDDIVIFSESKEFLHELLAHSCTYLKDELDLNIKPNYTINSIKEGIDMVGYRFFRGYILLRKNLKQRIIKCFTSIKELNERKWCACMSYIGLLSWNNSYAFALKYFYPITKRLDAYYEAFKRRKNHKLFSSWSKYIIKYKINITFPAYSHLKLHGGALI